VEDKSETVETGSWYGGNGSLFLICEDGSYEDYEYRLERSGQGRQLRLVSGDHGETWQASN
jgi:hypothetical protein